MHNQNLNLVFLLKIEKFFVNPYFYLFIYLCATYSKEKICKIESKNLEFQLSLKEM